MSVNQVLQDNLTPEQFLAASDESRQVLCLACAGSGKSRTLAYRIARLIAEGNSPSSIVAFTFTDKAADSIKRRVADALERCGLPVEMVGAMYIGTIHSFCQKLLAEIDAKYGQFEVLDDNGLKLFLLSRYPSIGLNIIRTEKGARMFETINEVSNAWKVANDEFINYDEVARYNPSLGRSLNIIYSKLISDQYLDFSLMIRLAVEALQARTPGIERALQEVRHLMVDEYQDVNPSQEALITQLYQRLDTLFVVGDDDQSIYGWRGADVRNIIEFDQRYVGCATHNLNTNFRSTNAIVETSNIFIQTELAQSRINKNPIAASNQDVRQFGNLWFDNRQEESQWIANRITQLLGTKYVESDGTERGLTKADFAILMRSVLGGTRNGNPPNHTAYTTALTNSGITYTIEAEGSIFERPHALVLRGAMDLLRNPGGSRAVAVSFFNTEVLASFPHADLNAFTTVLSNWNTQIHTPVQVARRKVYPQNLIHELLEAFRVSRSNFDDTVLRDLGVFSSIILDVEKVYVSIDSTQRFQEILNFLGNLAESGYDTSEVELMARPDAVTVSTVHKMKGLEFPVVFVVDVIQQRFPGNNSSYQGWLPVAVIQAALDRGLYQSNNAGESRLFYTALTRAERFLYVTGSAIQPGLNRPKRPSRFKVRLNHNEITTDPNLLPDNLEPALQRRRVEDNSMPTSFTEIKEYLECPMKFKFSKVFGFSPAVPELFGFGLTTHTSINRIHQQFENNAPTIQEAEQIVESVFHLKHVFPSNDPVRLGPYERAKIKSREIVTRYVDEYPLDFHQKKQVEVQFEIKAEQALITGAIDLLLREDNNGQVVDAKVIDFKSMDYPEELDNFFWINLSLQVQLYAHAAHIVLGENARVGAVHLLKAPNDPATTNRVEVPISDQAINSAIDNIKWAVSQILNRDFPKRPSDAKCEACDFKKICSKQKEDFITGTVPPEIFIPNLNGLDRIMVKAFSDCI